MTNIGLHGVFLFVGIAGAALLVLTIIGRMIGFGDHDSDGGDGGDHGAFHGALANPLSISNMAAFMALFGLMGKELLDRQFGPITAILGGCLAGFVGMLIMGMVYYQLSKLNQSGTADPKAVIGQEATVIARIPGGHADIGLITVMLPSGVREYSAYTNAGGEIASGKRVRVIALETPTTVLVEQI